MTDFEMNRRFFLQTLLISGAAMMSRTAFGELEPEYPTSVPVIEADRVLSFTWDDIDRYPLTTSLALIPSRNIAVTGGDDCQLAVWNLESGELQSHFVADDDWIRSLGVSYDGAILATLSQNGSVKLWNTEDWKERNTFSKLENGVEGLAFSPDGKYIAVCGFEDYVTVFETETGRIKTELSMPNTGNIDIRFSPDGTYLAAAGRGGVIRIWDAAEFKKSKDLRSDERRVRALMFSPDGKLIASGGDAQQINVWDAASGKRIQVLKLGIGKTFSLCFCGNDILASGDSLNSIRLWNLGDQSEFARCYGHTGTVAAMYFDLEQGRLLSGGFDTTVRSWPIMQQ